MQLVIRFNFEKTAYIGEDGFGEDGRRRLILGKDGRIRSRLILS